MHLKIPFWQVAKLFNGQVLEYTIRHDFDLTHKEALGDQPLNIVTSDNNVLVVEGSILFHIDKNNAPLLWENVGDDFVSKVIRPVARSRIRIVLAEATSTEIRNNRTSIEIKIKEELDKMYMEKGLICDGVLLSEIKFIGDHAGESEKPIIKTDTEVFSQEKT